MDVYGENINYALIRRHGGTPRASVPFFMAGGLASRRRLSKTATARIAARSYDLVVGNGTLLEQNVLIVHNAVRRAAEVRGAANARIHDEAVLLQERVLAAGGFDIVVANSTLLSQELQKRYSLPADRLAVIPLGIDPAQFTPLTERHQREVVRQHFGVAPGQKLIGFITSGDYWLRGVDTLAQSIAGLPPALRANVRVLAIASRKNARIIRAEFARQRLTNHLSTAAKTDRIQDYYHAIDLLFHPARLETFGLVVAEAAACGCPVLTSTAVGAAELFTGESRLGVVADPSAELFTARLAVLLDDHRMLPLLGAAQQSDIRPYTWAAYANRFQAMIQDRGLLLNC